MGYWCTPPTPKHCAALACPSALPPGLPCLPCHHTPAGPNCCRRWPSCCRTRTGECGVSALAVQGCPQPSLNGATLAHAALPAPPPAPPPALQSPAANHPSPTPPYRLAVLHVCSSWAAAVQAVPALWPVVVLNTPPSKLMAQRIGAGEWDIGDAITACDEDRGCTLALLENAARLSTLAWRVRLEGGEQQARSNKAAGGSCLAGACSVLSHTHSAPCTAANPGACCFGNSATHHPAH